MNGRLPVERSVLLDVSVLLESSSSGPAVVAMPRTNMARQPRVAAVRAMQSRHCRRSGRTSARPTPSPRLRQVPGPYSAVPRRRPPEDRGASSGHGRRRARPPSGGRWMWMRRKVSGASAPSTRAADAGPNDRAWLRPAPEAGSIHTE